MAAMHVYDDYSTKLFSAWYILDCISIASSQVYLRSNPSRKADVSTEHAMSKFLSDVYASGPVCASRLLDHWLGVCCSERIQSHERKPSGKGKISREEPSEYGDLPKNRAVGPHSVPSFGGRGNVSEDKDVKRYTSACSNCCQSVSSTNCTDVNNIFGIQSIN